MILLDSAIPRDWFDWSNASVGLAGVILTVGAIWQATGAKSAARDARQAVYRRNASEDVKRLERLASDLLLAIETERDDFASYQARDFISECRNVREHHRALLGSDGGKLDAAFAHVREISRGIQEGKSRSRLIESAQTVSADMSSLVGILTRAIEGEGQ